jgi:hypothetical protein
MTPAPAGRALADTVLSFHLPEDSIRQRVHQIHVAALAHSSHIHAADFTSIHPRDLEFLFRAYEELFFGGLLQRALDRRKLRFRLSPRMTRAGGTTTRFRSRSGEVSYEIAIACSMLFDGFRENDRLITVCGLQCANRLEALQRIFEHELVHLTENLCWERSDCSAARFQDIARRLFLHRAHTHNLVTRRERAAQSGIRLGTRVTFTFEGRQLTGKVNRITKRATVLVEDAAGLKYSDGRRYKTFYVPIAQLHPAESQPAGNGEERQSQHS